MSPLNDGEGIPDPEYLRCQDCGVEADDVRRTACPLQAEVYEVQVDADLCDRCYIVRLEST